MDDLLHSTTSRRLTKLSEIQKLKIKKSKLDEQNKMIH